MAGPRLFDRVKDTTTTTGTGTVTLANSAPTGFRTFGSVLSDGDTCPYCIELSGEWEVGVGTYSTTGPTLARTTVLASSNGGSAVNFSAGTKNVFLPFPADFADLSALTEVSVPALTDEIAVAVSGIPGKQTVRRTLGLAGVTPGGRLTLTSGTPVTTSDVTGATNVYYAPYLHDYVRLYDGTRVREYNFSELTLALGTLVAFQGYDVFLYDNSGTLTLEATEWSNATATMTIASPCVVTWTGHGLSTGDTVTFTTSGALPTGVSANTQYWINRVDNDTFNLATSIVNLGAATYVNSSGSQSGTHTAHSPRNRQTAYTFQAGLGYVKSGDATRLLLGSFMTTSTTQTEDSFGGAHEAGGKRFLSNFYNEIHRAACVIDTTDSWSYNTAAWRAANNTAGNRVEIFNCVPKRVEAFATAGVTLNTSSGTSGVGIGVNSVTANSAPLFGGLTFTSPGTSTAFLDDELAAGYHSICWIEQGTGANTNTWRGDNGNTRMQTGLKAVILG